MLTETCILIKTYNCITLFTSVSILNIKTKNGRQQK